MILSSTTVQLLATFSIDTNASAGHKRALSLKEKQSFTFETLNQLSLQAGSDEWGDCF